MPTLSELAACCDLSQRHLARTFHEETGRSIGEHLAMVNRECASALLSSTDLPVSTIVAQAGFSSTASFSYAFRRATGVRPSDLRRSLQRLRRPIRSGRRGVDPA